MRVARCRSHVLVMYCAPRLVWCCSSLGEVVRWCGEAGHMAPFRAISVRGVPVPHSVWCAFRSASSGGTMSLRSDTCHIGAARLRSQLTVQGRSPSYRAAPSHGVPGPVRPGPRTRVSSRSSFGPSRPPPRGRAGGPPHVEAAQASPGPRDLLGGRLFRPPQAPFPARSSPPGKKVEKRPPFWGGAVQSRGGVGGLRPLT